MGDNLFHSCCFRHCKLFYCPTTQLPLKSLAYEMKKVTDGKSDADACCWLCCCGADMQIFHSLFLFSLLFFGNNFLLSSSRERKRGLPNKRKKNNRAAHTHHMPMRLEREGWASKHAAQLASRRKEIKIWNNSSIHVLFFSFPFSYLIRPLQWWNRLARTWLRAGSSDFAI